MSDGSNQTADPFFTQARLAHYESRVPAYFLALEAAAQSVLWIHCTISGGEPGHLYPFTMQGEPGLTFAFEIQNAAGEVQDWVSGRWGIAVYFHGENRMRKVKAVEIVAGRGILSGYNDTVSGDFDIRSETFAPVTLPDGRTFTFKLAHDIIFTICEA